MLTSPAIAVRVAAMASTSRDATVDLCAAPGECGVGECARKRGAVATGSSSVPHRDAESGLGAERERSQDPGERGARHAYAWLRCSLLATHALALRRKTVLVRLRSARGALHHRRPLVAARLGSPRIQLCRLCKFLFIGGGDKRRQAVAAPARGGELFCRPHHNVRSPESVTCSSGDCWSTCVLTPRSFRQGDY